MKPSLIRLLLCFALATAANAGDAAFSRVNGDGTRPEGRIPEFPLRAGDTWTIQGFDAFRRGTFGNAGQNLYVSKAGVLQRIYRFDVNGDGWFDLPFAAQLEKAKAKGAETDTNLELEGVDTTLMLTHEVYDKLIERNLRQPTFVTRLPHEFVPLAKTCKDDPSLVDVFEFVVGGRELCPGYTEQNDPIEQRKALEHQAGEDTEKIDEDFISALEVGMPPTGGLGIGIDRCVMLLTGCDSIRDVILFPTMKPEVN